MAPLYLKRPAPAIENRDEFQPLRRRPMPLARPPQFVVCPLMREIQAFRYFWPKRGSAARSPTWSGQAPGRQGLASASAFGENSGASKAGKLFLPMSTRRAAISFLRPGAGHTSRPTLGAPMVGGRTKWQSNLKFLKWETAVITRFLLLPENLWRSCRRKEQARGASAFVWAQASVLR